MENDFTDLVVVYSEGRNYVVAAPPFEAEIGELLEFRTSDRMTLLGPVIEKMTCQKLGEEWSLVSSLARIHDTVAIYKVKWSADPSDTKITSD